VPLQGGNPLQLIHRDIKPSNIMVTTEGEVKLLDFGTARANFETREAHTEALHFGSQIYMAPERFMGDRDTRSCDVFALGVTLFELLVGEATGRVQLREERYEATLKENLERVLLPGVDEKIQAEFRRVLGAMMAFHETSRVTAVEVEEAMEGLSEEVGGPSLRRFCRENVKEVMGDQETLEAVGDSLAGQTLEEDRTATFDTEGLPLGKEHLGPLTPTAGGSETSAGWLDDYDEDSEETAAAAAGGESDDSERTLHLGNVDEQPVWTSETFPGKQPGLQIPEGTTLPVPPPPVGSENTTASAPSLTGTLGFEAGELTQDATPPTQTGFKKGWVIAAVAALGVGGAVFLGGGSDEPALPSEAAPVVVEAPVPVEPAEEAAVATAEEAVPGEPAPEVLAAEDGEEVAAPVAAPAKPRPSAAPPASSRPGSLKLNTLSVGGAQVKVTHTSGFLRICRSPCIRLEIGDLKPGTYTTRVTPKSGGPEEALKVRVRAGRTCRYNLKKSASGLQWEERGCE
jgi:hypothetical protein